MIKKIRHTGIVVRDLDISMHFYCDLLGFKITRQLDESGVYVDNMLSLDQVRVATVKMTAPDGQMIELLKFHTHLNEQKPRDINNVGITHIAF
ncbi:MAG: VOC family protein, partial [Dehalococcoidia bacterium]|nr:VOC family protein [Dehalococcoidia bacterium]